MNKSLWIKKLTKNHFHFSVDGYWRKPANTPYLPNPISIYLIMGVDSTNITH